MKWGRIIGLSFLAINLFGAGGIIVDFNPDWHSWANFGGKALIYYSGFVAAKVFL